MPFSLKRQRKRTKRSEQQHRERKKARKVAAEQLTANRNDSLRSISRNTGVSRGVLMAIKTSIATNDSSSLKSLTSPQKRPGAQPILRYEEEEMVAQHCIKAARRGFACSECDLKGIMGRIASDGRVKTYKNGVPSGDALHSFRARHPELTFRRVENKSAVKLKGENYFHAKTYEDALRSVSEEFPSIFEDGDFDWNMDETHVDGEFGKRQRVISDASTHHGGFSKKTARTGSGRHVTVVVAISASGKKCPPFYIIEGKRNMGNWYLPLPSESSTHSKTEVSSTLEEKGGSLQMHVS